MLILLFLAQEYIFSDAPELRRKLRILNPTTSKAYCFPGKEMRLLNHQHTGCPKVMDEIEKGGGGR